MSELEGWRWGDDLCRPFVDQLPVTGASISVIGTLARRMTVCYSDTVAAQLEGLQFDLGEGPQWEVMKTGLPVLSPDLSLRNTANWPVFGSAAARLGAAAVFAFPIAVGAVTVGVVDLYRTTSGALDGLMFALARSLAEQVAAPAVKAAISSAEEDQALENAGTPTMRREVHQATGMIIAQLEVSAAEAFSLLRGHAFVSGRSVEDVASDVVARLLDFRQLPN
ncbi:ANTAR domain-containing protein [Glaciihabitans sp. INWT7]|uniref:ANTAR domain-containing protein n=1 Tax=Glaciihabitans sp. INWT7 TaxID=2596912 RepID=UPI001626243E|nr:ANTAR domain-containing protein [Glaciihabitans sp. INWT7]